VAPIIITIVKNARFVGDVPVWIPKQHSYIEYDISGCRIDTSNAEIISVQFMNDQKFYDHSSTYQKNIILTSNIPGISDIFTVTVRKLRNAQKAFAYFNWEEYY
jgi:hypothetical protein